MAKNPLIPRRIRKGRSFNEYAIASSAIPVVMAQAAIKRVTATNIAKGETTLEERIEIECCGGGHIVQEHRGKEPLINTGLFANRAYSLQNVNVLLIQMAMDGVMVIIPFCLELVKKIPAGNVGTILLTLPVGMILTTPIAGKISDVIGTKKPIIAGFAVCALALFLLSTISAETSVGHISIDLFLLGAGTGIAFSPLNSAVMGECPVKDQGATSGLVKMITNLG